MQDIGTKADATGGASGELTAAEFNDHNVEIEKVVTNSGQTLNPAITDQLSKALFIYGTGAASVVDSGSGNTITLQPLTGGSGLVPPDAYLQLNGGVLCFNKATINTGTAVTIAFGTLGAKALVRKDGSLPAIGDVIGKCYVKWDNSADKWVLLRNETDTYKYTIAASGAIVPKFANNSYEIDTSGGSVVISALPLPDFLGQRIDFIVTGSGTGTITAGTGITFNQVLTSAEGESVISVDKAGTLAWELVVDRKTTLKAFVNFNGSGVIAIRDSFNVSSITDVGAGDYTVNYTNNMKDANYSAVPGCSDSFSATTIAEIASGSMFIGSIGIRTRNAAAGLGDPNVVTLNVFGL